MSIFRQLATFATSYVYLSAENFQQQFEAREVCRASQLEVEIMRVKLLKLVVEMLSSSSIRFQQKVII